uniref:Pleckstriny domain-containing family M member 3 n=1 Tax=Ascaris suum TaxID=6253 RepID=F1KTF9_ASCSU
MTAAEIIKAALTKEFKLAVKNGCDEADLNGSISDDLTQTICNIVEAIFIHGLKDPFFVRGSRYAKYPEPNFWPLLHKYTHVSIMNQISAAKHIKSDIGKARAWIRIVLNEDALEHYLNLFWHDPISMCKYYDKSAYLRDLEHFNLMIGCVKAIAELGLCIPINNPLLNTWTPTPLILSGLVAGKPARLEQLRSRRHEPPTNEQSDTEVAESALDLIESPSINDEPGPSTSRPLSRGLNSGDDDDLSSVYSHPSMLDGGLLGGRRRISRDLYPSVSTPNGSYVSKLVQSESHLSDDSYEVRVLRRRHRARRASKSSSDDGSRSRSNSSTNRRSLPLQSPSVPQVSPLYSPGEQCTNADRVCWLNSRNEQNETIEQDVAAPPSVPEPIEEEGDVPKKATARDEMVGSAPVKILNPRDESVSQEPEIKHSQNGLSVVDHEEDGRKRAEPIDILKAQVAWDLMSADPSCNDQVRSSVFVSEVHHGEEGQKSSVNTVGRDETADRIIDPSSGASSKEAVECTEGRFGVAVTLREDLDSSSCFSTGHHPGASESEREEGINHRGAIVIPKSPEICDVMSPTECTVFTKIVVSPSSERSAVSLQDEILFAESGSAGNSLLGKGWTNHPPLNVQEYEPTSGQSSSTGTDSSHNFDAMIRNTLAACDYEEMETKVRSRLDSEMFADTLNEGMVSGIEIGRASISEKADEGSLIATSTVIPADRLEKRNSIDRRAVIVNEADMNGEDEYGIARAMIPLLTTIPREKGLDQQNFRCASCNRSIGPTFASYMVCALDAKYYCEGCSRKGETSVIPSRLIHNWDFQARPVCRANMSFINAIADRPIIRIDKINPHLYEHCETMKNIKFLREKMGLAVMYLLTCRESVAEDLRMRLWPKEYLFNDIHLYSFTDLLSVLSGQLERHLQSIIVYTVEHIRRCVLCAQKGFVCEICACPRVIYPFQVETTFRCSKCYSVYHKECIGEKRCPKCLRREQYAKRPDISPDHLPLD